MDRYSRRIRRPRTAIRIRLAPDPEATRAFVPVRSNGSASRQREGSEHAGLDLTGHRIALDVDGET